MPDFRVKFFEKRSIARETAAFFFEKPADFHYQAGQCVRIYLRGREAGEERDNRHTMSLAAAPFEPNLMIAMRMTGSPFKQALAALRNNDEIYISEARGHIGLLQTTDRPLVFIAGGIGIAPFRGMILQDQHEGFPHRIFLFYSSRFLEDAAFLEELQAIQHPNFTCIPTLTNAEKLPNNWQHEFGRVDLEMIAKHLGKQGIPAINPQNTANRPLSYIIGTPTMVTDLRQQLLTAEIASEDVVIELFTGY